MWVANYMHQIHFLFFVKFSGGIYHSLPPVLPQPGQDPRFVQIYILDSKKDQLNARIMHDTKQLLNRSFLSQLNNLMFGINPFARKFKRITNEFIKGKDCKEVNIEILDLQGEYAAPRENEIAVFMPNSTQHMTQPFCSYRNIQLRNFNGQNQSINEMNGMYDPLHYPLMFPYGDLGYSYLNRKTYVDRKQLTPQDYYAQLIQFRPDAPPSLYMFSRLFKEYLCDQYAKIESWRLNYIRQHQDKIKAACYSGVVDFLNVAAKKKGNNNSSNNTNSAFNDDIKLGKTHVVLPGTFQGGPIWYHTRFLNAMNMVNKVGPSTLIGTMTTNPNWPEIQNQLGSNETAYDKIDLVC